MFCPVCTTCATRNTRPRGSGKETTMETLMEINGVRMAHDKRALSMDEAAQVAGGAWDTIDFYGEEMSMADFNTEPVLFT